MIKAIETRYKGYRFRSRLEARWAVFFDALSLRWEYEPEGYDLPSGRYLPDFFLPDVRDGVWLEVKPDTKTTDDDRAITLIRDLAMMTKNDAMIVKGIPLQDFPDNECSFYDPPGFRDGSAYWMHFYHDPVPEWDIHEPWLGSDGPYIFCVCNECGKAGIEFDGRGDRVCASSGCKTSSHGDKGYSSHHPKIIRAAQAARSARFEHGEVPL